MDFSSLVLTERPASYDAGGVRAATVRNITDQGALVSTRNNMDLAISGRGFLPVTDIAAVQRGDPDLPGKLMRTGSFRPDGNGVMRTNSGYALMGFKAEADGTFDPGLARESVVDLVPVNIADIALAAQPTANIILRGNLDARNTGDTNATAQVSTIPVTYYDVLGGEEALTFSFTPNIATGGENQWTLAISDETGNIGNFAFEFNDTTSPAGYLASVTPDAGNPATTTWDGVAGTINLQTSDGAGKSIQIGVPGEIGPLSQFKTDSEPRIEKDGSPVSSIVGVEVNESGVVDAIFDSGFRKSIYQIPIGNVQNPNALNVSDGPVYTLSGESGNIYFYDAGAGPTGRLVANALEESTTDIAEELTQLIKTQRAYSSNAKIITTVDEMLQETTNLKR